MIRLSTGAVNFIMQYGSFKRAFYGGNMKIYSGGQPATADAAVTGTLGLTVTTASGALTHEVRPAGSVTFTGTSGSITSITLAGYEILGATVTCVTSPTVTAAAVAAQINKFCSRGCCECYAESLVGKVTIYAVQGSGAVTGAIATTVSGGDVAKTDVALGTEVTGTTMVNGFDFGTVAAGVLQKDGVWSGVASNTITAGWFRIEGSIADDDSLSTSLIRMDGNCGTSGADLNMATTSLVSGNTYTIDTAGITLPMYSS